jgi:hypothetical protein
VDPFGWLDWFDAHEYEIARQVLQRGVGALALIAFLSTLNQFRPLLGEHGLLPVPELLRLAPRLRGPSVFRWGYSDRRLVALAITGLVLAASVVLGLPQLGPPWLPMLVFLALWIGYLSIVNVGQTFYGFGWEMLLCEALFTVAFLGSDQVPPPLTIIIAVWWLVFRLEFGAGMIKIRGGREWRDLTALMYHHETQPMPNPLSWFFHKLPRSLHRAETIGNFVAQLVLPFGLFLPQPFATVAAVLMIATQLYLVVSGNYAWLNWVTIVVMTAAIADPVLRALVPGLAPGPAAFAATPAWFTATVVAVTLLVIVLSAAPLRNLLSPRQAMNASFDPLRLVNTYGAFGSVSRVRDEVIVEGTDAPALDHGTDWREYEFKGKPGDVRRVPPQFAPYHLRLDWLMWFLPLSSRYGERWFIPFLVKLLEGDRQTLALLRGDPFPDRPPQFVRAQLYRYRFTTWRERRETGAWWARTLVGEFVAPIRLRP